MPIVASDWTITRSTGAIRYIGQDHNGGALITTGAFVVGDYYRIHTVGDTDFTLIGAASNTVGVEFVATGVGGGTTGKADEAASYATVIQLHRWGQSLADDAASTGDDEMSIIDVNPSARSTDNIITLKNSHNIDATAAEHLYDGSIIQGSGGTEAYYDGILNYGNASNMIQLHQNGSVLVDDFWNYSRGGTATGGTSTILTDTDNNYSTNQWLGYTIKNVTDGSQGIITANDATTITVAALYGGTANTFATSDVYLIARGINPDAAQGISHRFLINTRTGGADIDGRRLLGQSRRYGNTFSEFPINGTARGNNVLALVDGADLNNKLAHATVDAYTDVTIDRTDSTTTVNGVNSAGQADLLVASGAAFSIGEFINIAGFDDEYKIDNIVTNTLTLNRNLVSATAGSEVIYILNMGFTQLDVDNNAANEDYYAQWDKGSRSINGFFEKMKLISADSSEHYIYGLPGEQFRGITHEIPVDTNTGTFHEAEQLTWTEATIASTGQMLATDSVTAGTKVWIQLTSGIVPTDGTVLTGADSSATVAVNGVATSRVAELKKPFVGASTGTALVGSYGLALQTADLSSTDLVFDLGNNPITPPNNVTFTVGSIVSGDYVLVAPRLGTDGEGNPAIDKNSIALATTLSGATETQVVVDTINAWTPATGSIRVITDSGEDKLVWYKSWSGTTYLMDDTHGDYATFRDFSGDNATVGAGKDVYVTYIDDVTAGTSESFTAVYSADKDLVVLVRDGGATPIKEFIGAATFGANNSTTPATRTTDA